MHVTSKHGELIMWYFLIIDDFELFEKIDKFQFLGEETDISRTLFGETLNKGNNYHNPRDPDIECEETVCQEEDVDVEDQDHQLNVQDTR